MSKFPGCIVEAVDGGQVAAETGAEIRAVYDDALAAASQSLGPMEADRAASRVALSALEAQAIRAKQLHALSLRTRREALSGAAAYKTARGYQKVKALGGGGNRPPKDGWVQGGEPPKEGPFKGGGVMADYLKELVDGSGGLAGSATASIKGRYQALFASYQAMLPQLIEKMESVTGLPIRGRALLDNVVREAFGETSGDAAAKALAGAWHETADYARKTFNAAGGAIGKLEHWGLPQSHDPLAIRAAGKAAWVADLTPRLDRARMVDGITKMPFSDKRLGAVLGEVYDTILTHGAIDREPGEALGKGMLANQRGDHRFLIFKDADNWLDYARQFGAGDPYATMIRHLDSLARDTARMQVLGPNPDHQFDFLTRVAQREIALEQALPGAAKEGVLNHADGRIKTAKEMYRQFVGDVSGPYGAENVVADVGAAARGFLSGVQLGAAVINDLVSNPVFAAQTRAFAGLSKGGDFQAWAKFLVSGKTRETARRTGLIFDLARERHAGAVQRVLRSQTVGGKVANGMNAFGRLLPNWINQVAFLEANRGAQRFAFQAEFMGHLADLAGHDLPALLSHANEPARAFGALLQARGFTPADWDKLRALPADENGFLTPHAIGQVDDELGWRVAEMIERETRLAVPEPGLWSRAQLMMKTDPGTVQGEIVRSAASYRSFTVTQTYNWTREFMIRAQKDADAPGLPWQMKVAMSAAPMFIGATLSGAAALWLKDMSKGNDPRPLWDEDDPKAARSRAFKFIGAAMAQGGGQGILGDFLNSVQARNGKSAAATAFGPALGMVSDTYGLTVGNVNEALAGEETHAGREAVKYAARYNPLASLWWSRTAWDRTVLDQVQRLVDPDAQKDFDRAAKRLARETGQKQWWPEGQVAPERAPDLGAVTGP